MPKKNTVLVPSQILKIKWKPPLFVSCKTNSIRQFKVLEIALCPHIYVSGKPQCCTRSSSLPDYAISEILKKKCWFLKADHSKHSRTEGSENVPNNFNLLAKQFNVDTFMIYDAFFHYLLLYCDVKFKTFCIKHCT